MVPFRAVDTRGTHCRTLASGTHIWDMPFSNGGCCIRIGVRGRYAPFCYNLDLVMGCEGLPVPLKQGGVNELVEQGQSKTFSFKGIPVTSLCLQQISIALDSSYVYSGRPVQFAQGTNGTVVLRLPLPPVVPPLASPINAPISVPTRAPEKIELLTAARALPPAPFSTPAPRRDCILCRC
jgi:hypothetical protein